MFRLIRNWRSQPGSDEVADFVSRAQSFYAFAWVICRVAIAIGIFVAGMTVGRSM